jgi:diguanylate cyclase (GGDEF)-like protein
MKPTAVLVNTSRGPVVDQVALAAALRDGVIAAAALDVTDPEPIPMDDPLVGMDNCLIVPHIASASRATRGKMAEMAAANLLAVWARRRPDSRWYTRFSALQVLFDTVTILAFVIVSERDFPQTTWPLLGLSISIAAIRHQLLGAVLTMVATSAAFVALRPDSPDIAFVLGVDAMTAIIAGAQSSAFARQLTTLQETRLALQHQATHDALTGLPNRAQLAAYADECAGRPLAVLLLDLNGFKQVNDGYGHAAGDLLLHEVGVRLTAALGSEGLAGRHGGDEFLVLLPGGGQAAVTAVSDRIREAIRCPAHLGDGIEVTVGVSVGVALRPAGGVAGLDALTAEADAAMYREKHGRMAA